MWEERVIAMTGAGSGIGRELALAFAERGAVVAISDIDGAGLEETAKVIRDAGGRAHAQQVDVAKRSDIEAWCDEIVNTFGTVDAVINNAGVSVIDGCEFISPTDFEWIMGINFWGVVHGSQVFLPHLRRAETGYIVNISSLFGLISIPAQSAYNASKFAVRGFTEALRQEMYGTNIHVLSVHPGGIKTNITRNSRHHHRQGLTHSKERMVKQFETRLAKVSARDAAEQIINGMEKRRKRLLIGRDAKFLDLVVRLFPVGYEALVRRLRRKVE